MRSTSTPFHVVVATDENFAMPTAVTLRSLFTAGDTDAQVTVIHDGLSLEAVDSILTSLPPTAPPPTWFDVGDFDVRPTTASHLPDSTYFRLRLADAVPAERGRILYLDVDMLVRRPLGALAAVDMKDHTLAAVQSINYPFVATRGAVDHWRPLGLDPRAGFFNAGLLLVDLQRWRSRQVAERALEYLRSPNCGKGADQEALNVVCTGDWLPLDPTWNQQTPMLDDQHGAHLLYDTETIEAARTDPHIVHFQTRPKPWHRHCDHPWRSEWLDVAAQTRFDIVTDLRERTIADEWRWRTRRAASALVKGR